MKESDNGLLFGAKLLSEPVLTYGQSDPLE